MASDLEIQTYLALWFQLGKSVVSQSTGSRLRPRSVSHDNAYSAEFTECWRVISQHPDLYYLEGTEQSIEELRSPAWEFIYCARCVMPVPMRLDSAAFGPCPCQDLPLWPNVELPLPRLPISNRKVLNNICHRLTTKADQPVTDTTTDRQSLDAQPVAQPLQTAANAPVTAPTTQPTVFLVSEDDPDQTRGSERKHGLSDGEPDREREADLDLDDTLSPTDCAIALSIHSEQHRPGHWLSQPHSPTTSQEALGQQRQESLYQAQCQYHHHHHHHPPTPETAPQDSSTAHRATPANPATDQTWSVSPAVSPAAPSQPPYEPVYPHCQVPPSGHSASPPQDSH